MDHEHPDVLPQPSQTKHEPAIRIFTPQVMHSGASDLTPVIFSKSSIDDPTPAVEVLAAGADSIFTSATFAATADAFGVSTTFGAGATGAIDAFASGVYSPVSRALKRLCWKISQ